MDVEDKIKIVEEIGEEIITKEELHNLFETKNHPIAYDGFEPSGMIHIAQGIMRAINTNKLLDTGVKFKFWVADWFAWINNKMGGDLDKIRTVGNYMIEVWKACGMDVSKVEFVWSNDVMGNKDYWKRVLDIARHNSLNRIVRCSQIMGRTEKESLSAAQIFYPCMQCSDIFELGVDITNLGMDQRKVNMLAREVGPKIGMYRPVVVNYHMLLGLNPPPANLTDPIERKIAMKMSKSNPNSAIFMTDNENDVNEKIKNAYCPEKIVDNNPILEYLKYIIFRSFDEVVIDRPKKFGGMTSFISYNDLESSYVNGDIHPLDLKNTTAKYINMLLDPVRKHFERNQKAKNLLETVNSFKVTR